MKLGNQCEKFLEVCDRGSTQQVKEFVESKHPAVVGSLRMIERKLVDSSWCRGYGMKDNMWMARIARSGWV